MANSSTLQIPSMRGAKWLREATYLTDEQRAAVLATVDECKRAHPEWARSVGVRPAAYIGEPAAIASVTYGPGGSRLYGGVYA